MTTRRPLLLDVDTYRYRVVEVIGMLSEGLPVPGEVREFASLEGAQRRMKRDRQAGKSVLLQVGKLHWMNGDENEAEVQRLESPRPVAGNDD